MDGLEAAPAPDYTDQPAEPEGAPEGTSAETPSEDLFSPAPDLTDGEWTQERLTERHKQMQADYTRKTQEIASIRDRAEELQFLDALRSDPDTQKAVLEQLQELLAETEAEVDDGPSESPLEQQVRELREVQEARQAQDLAKNIVDHLDQLQKKAGVTLDEHDLQQVFTAATENGVGQQQTEDAFKAFVAREKARQETWLKGYLESKQAPQQVPAGTPAQDTPDLSKAEVRQARMAAILEGGRS